MALCGLKAQLKKMNIRLEFSAMFLYFYAAAVTAVTADLIAAPSVSKTSASPKASEFS